MDPLLPACSMLLSVLTHVGSADEQQAMNAFSAAAQLLSSGGVRLHGRHETRVERVDIALEELAQAAPQLKRKVLAACTTCIAHDAKVTTQEADCCAPSPTRSIARCRHCCRLVDR